MPGAVDMIRGRRFRPARWSLLLTVFGIGVFVALGYWQLERAALKQSIQDTYERRLEMDYRTPDLDAGRDAIAYARLLLRGRYLSAHNFLLDNQVHQGQAGYHVLTPFRLADGSRIVLVDRGWAAWGGRREVPAEIPLPAEADTIAGIAFYPEAAAFALGRIELSADWPQIIPRLDLDALREQYDEDLLPFVLWLAPERPGQFVRSWQPVWLPPEKSRAYALQWFSFAALALVLFVILNLRKAE